MHLAIVLKRGFCEHLTAYRSSLAYRRFARVPDGGPISSHAPCFEQPGRNIKTSVTFSPTSLPLPLIARPLTLPAQCSVLVQPMVHRYIYMSHSICVSEKVTKTGQLQSDNGL